MTAGFQIGALVLAAGASARMGRPKALLLWRGRTFVEILVSLVREAGCSPIRVVEGAHPLGDWVAPDHRVVAANWRAGQLASLQAGLATLDTADAPTTGILVVTVDRPHVRIDTVRSLIDAHARTPDAIWQPAFQGRRGHPILYPTDVARRLSTLPQNASARDVLRSPDVAPRRRTVAVDDPAVCDNIDRPQDLAVLPGLTGADKPG